MPDSAMAASSRCRRARAREGLFPIVPIIPPRSFLRHVSLHDIVRDRVTVAQTRLAPSAAAGGAEDQAIARLHRHIRRLEEILFGAVAPNQHGFVDGTRPAAVEPPGRVLG